MVSFINAHYDDRTFPGKATQGASAIDPNGINPQELKRLSARLVSRDQAIGAFVFYWLLTCSASSSSEAFKMFSKHISLNHNVNSIYGKAGTFNITNEPI